MVQGWWPNALVLPGPKKLLSSTPRSRSAVITAVARQVLGRKPTAKESSAARKLLSGTKLPRRSARGPRQQRTVALVTILLLPRQPT